MANSSVSLSPYGEFFDIALEGQRVRIREVGASLYSYDVDGQPVVAGPGVSPQKLDALKGSRGAILIPFPNRVNGGKYQVDGNTLQMATTGDHAMHGFARTQRWTVEDRTPHSIALTTTIYAQIGYPFVMKANVQYTLSESGLRVAMSATNLGDHRLPIVMGVHPYFTVGSSTVDADELTVPASKFLPLDDLQIPTGEHSDVEGSPFDFRSKRSLNGVELDVCFTELARGHDGIARVLLHSSETNRSLDIWMDKSFEYIQAFTADTLAIEDDRRKTVAIEPMTGAADAFNNRDGLIWLEADQTTQGTWGVTPS